MRPLSFDPNVLRQHLRRHTIATLNELKRALGTPVDVTVFRKLQTLDYLASYSHRGAYYTLRPLARFSPEGLWSHEGVWFSRSGTLVATAEAFVTQSSSGYFADELARALHVEVHDALRALTTQGRLRRTDVSGVYLYTAAESTTHRRQVQARRTAHAVPIAVAAPALQSSPGTMAELLTHHGCRTSPIPVSRLLHHLDYSLHVNRKQIATTFSPDRDQQFHYIGELRDRFQRRHWHIISVDTKKRELVGLFKNAGARWDRQPWPVNDHDFRSDARGIAIPYGVDDPLGHRGSIIVGVSHNTPAFAAHAVAHWWRREGRVHYAPARELLILADTGGSNGYRRAARETELPAPLPTRLHLPRPGAPHPPGASQRHPLRHPLLSQ